MMVTKEQFAEREEIVVRHFEELIREKGKEGAIEETALALGRIEDETERSTR